LVVITATKDGTWERKLGFLLCAAAVSLLARVESTIMRRIGWNVLALSFVLLAVADFVHGRAADVALYTAVGVCLVSSFLLLNVRKWS
jgi:hypothetical protein